MSAEMRIKDFQPGDSAGALTLYGYIAGGSYTEVVRISAEGDVLIDWAGVEKYVLLSGEKDAVMLAICRALLAVRDSTWKPICPTK